MVVLREQIELWTLAQPAGGDAEAVRSALRLSVDGPYDRSVSFAASAG